MKKLQDLYNKYEKDLIFLMSSLVALIAFWGPMIRKSFNSDTIIHIADPTADVPDRLMEGRFVQYVFDAILFRRGLRTTDFGSIFTIIAFILFAFGLLALKKVFEKWEPQDVVGKIIFWCCINLIYLNVLFSEMLMFQEVVAYFALAYLCSHLAALYYARKKYVLMAIFLLVAVGAYQYTAVYTAILLTFYLMFELDFKFDITAVIKELIMVIICMVAGALNMIMVQLLVKIGLVEEFRKISGFGDVPGKILMAFKDIISLNKNSMGVFPNLWIPGILNLALIITLLIAFIKRKEINKIVYLAMTLLTSVILMFSLGVMTFEYFQPPRMCFVFYLIQGMLGLSILVLFNKKSSKLLAWAFVGYLLFQCLFAGFITSGRFVSNALDRINVNAFIKEIDRYQSETGTEVKYIALVNDIDAPPYYEETKYHTYQINERSLSINNYSTVDALSGRKYQWKEMEPSVYEEYFANKNWDAFDAKEQIVIIDDTAYWCIY